jgi:hypothetical protein
MEDVQVTLDLDDWEMILHTMQNGARNLRELGGSGARTQASHMQRIITDIMTECCKVDPEFGDE